MRGLRCLGLIALLLFAVAAFTPLANLINIWMAGVSHVEPSDAIVILGRGGADADDVLTNRSLRRLLRGVGLYHDGFAPLLVLSGSAGETRASMTLASGFRIPDTAMQTSGHTPN